MLLHHIKLTKIMEDVDIMEGRKIIEAEEDVEPNVEEIGDVAMVARVPVI